MKNLPSCSFSRLPPSDIPSFRAGFGLEFQSQGSRFIPNHCLCPSSYFMWHKKETCCSQESNTDSADRFSSENDSSKASKNHLGPVSGSCLLDRIVLTFWELEKNEQNRVCLETWKSSDFCVCPQNINVCWKEACLHKCLNMNTKQWAYVTEENAL